MPRVPCGAALAATAVLLILPGAALAAVSVTRAELSGGRLRVEGGGVVANAIVTVTSPESTASATADGAGAFRVEAANYRSSTCRVTVSDGATSVQATLSGCTPVSPPPPPPPSPPPPPPPPPPPDPGSGTMSALTISPDIVTGGATSTGTATLAASVSTSTTVTLASTDTAVATVPATVTVPAGAISATFTITTKPVTGTGTFADISGTAGGVTRGAPIHVNPAPTGPTLSSVSFVPANVTGSGASTGTVTFSGPTDGAVVSLTSSDPAVASVPAETVVNQGQSSGTFPVSTTSVTAVTSVTITATAFGVSRTGTLTVSPGAAPPTDTVAIVRAEWQAGLLRIEATSTNPNAILSVYSESGSFMFTLTNNGGGRYSDQRGFVFAPSIITVKSNFGGSATRAVARK